jgi:hypothetical protein
MNVNVKTLAGLDGSFRKRVDEAFRPGPHDLHADMLGTGSIGSDEWYLDLRLGGQRQLELGFLGSLVDTLNHHLIRRQVNARRAATRQPMLSRYCLNRIFTSMEEDAAELRFPGEQM